MVKSIKAYQFSVRFKKEYNDLPKEIQKAFDKKYRFLAFVIRRFTLISLKSAL